MRLEEIKGELHLCSIITFCAENDSSAPNLVPAVHQKFSELFP